MNTSLTARPQRPTCDYSIEYCHIYTNERVGHEHIVSLEKLNAVTARLESHDKSYNLCVMVDDYTFPGENFDYAELLGWLGSHGAEPHFWVQEGSLIPCADTVISLVEDSKRQKSLQRYVARKRYPCSLFIAAWYLARLGRLPNAPAAIDTYAQGLINILPTRFEPFENEARSIIATTKHRDVLRNIHNEYLAGDTFTSNMNADKLLALRPNTAISTS